MNTISVILKEYWGIFKSYIKEGGNYDKSNGNVIKSDKKKRKCDKVVIKRDTYNIFNIKRNKKYEVAENQG